VFTALAARTGARVISAHGRRGVPTLVGTVAAASGGWRRSVRVASAQLLRSTALAVIRGPVTTAVLDLHDHPGLQAESLGIPLTSTARGDLDGLVTRNVARFERVVVPSASFAELGGLPADRVIVVTNGTDTEHVVPRPAPSDPVVGMISGAAPGRGIEHLLEAMSTVRTEIPEATLRLALTATGPASARYLQALGDRVRGGVPWITLDEIPYRRLGDFLGGAAVLVIPHPAGAYMDVSTPVKLFDSMAAGRPLAVTPRTETRRIVEAARAGIVAASDRVEDLAEAIWTLLRDEPQRRTLGENARRAAVERYDWRVLSAALADAVLGPQNASR
jgi:glycosyltransferase involved in cell wall biosynthesis